MTTTQSFSYHPHRPLRTVLIGTLLEKESDPVVRAGLAVARAAGARVSLVHGLPEGPRLAGLEIGMGEDYAAELRELCQEKLRDQIERLGIAATELDGAEIRTGEPHRVLIDTARAVGADLIVLGATGYGAFAAELLGSTAERVLRKAACPVLVVRGELQVPPRSVLAPVDLSPLSGDAFRCGLDLLAQVADGSEVRAVHAVNFTEQLAQSRRQGHPVPSAEGEGEELRRFVLQNQGAAPFAVETSLLSGEARHELLHELGEHPVDLVLIGTHGRGGMDRLMLGSVASTLARKAPCSVLVVSPEAALAEGIAEAITARMAPAWHREPAPVS